QGRNRPAPQGDFRQACALCPSMPCERPRIRAPLPGLAFPAVGAPGRKAARPWGQFLIAVLCLGLLLALPAAAATVPGGAEKGASEAILLAQIVVLVLLGRLMGEAMLWIGQPAVMGQLLAGIVLGPSLFGALWPAAQQTLFPPSPEQKSMIDGIAQFGI